MSTLEKKQKKISRKTQIIKSALTVFCVKGYEATTVDDIVKKAGCSHGLFYHYFKNKQEVFEAVIKRHQERHIKDVTCKIKDLPTCKEKLRFALLDLIEEYATNEDLSHYFYFFLSQAFNIKSNNLPLPKITHGPRVRTVEVFTNIIKEGQESGEFTTKYTLTECVILLFSIITGAAISHVVSPKEISAKMPLPNVDFILDIFTGETKWVKKKLVKN